MIAVDTNVLVYAYRADSAFHAPARDAIESLAGARRTWAIPWPCAHEFLAIVTHPRIYRTPTPAATALGQLRSLAALPHLSFIGEMEDPLDHLDHLEPLVIGGRVQGGAVQDARIAAICLAHGVQELWSADRDFGRFPALEVRNPLV